MSETIYDPETARAAARQLDRRRRKAFAAVREGRVTRARAEAALAPWAAIACLCGAETPELIEAIAERACVQVDDRWPAPTITEADARAMIAADTCPRGEWATVLESARDAAAMAARDGAPADDAADLARIVDWLETDPAGRRHLRPIGATIPNERRAA